MSDAPSLEVRDLVKHFPHPYRPVAAAHRCGGRRSMA